MIKIKPRRQAFQLTTDLEQPFDLDNHLPFKVAVVSNLLALNRDWKIRQACQLDPREMRVLINIGSYMPIKSADIAYQSRLDSYTVSRAVKKLLQLKLIETQPDAYKKNVKNLVLKAEGEVLYRQITKEMENRDKVLNSVLSEEERETFSRLLDKLEHQSEAMLANQALDMIAEGEEAPADQKELIRWFKKSQGR